MGHRRPLQFCSRPCGLLGHPHVGVSDFNTIEINWTSQISRYSCMAGGNSYGEITSWDWPRAGRWCSVDLGSSHFAFRIIKHGGAVSLSIPCTYTSVSHIESFQISLTAESVPSMFFDVPAGLDLTMPSSVRPAGTSQRSATYLGQRARWEVMYECLFSSPEIFSWNQEHT